MATNRTYNTPFNLHIDKLRAALLLLVMGRRVRKDYWQEEDIYLNFTDLKQIDRDQIGAHIDLLNSQGVLVKGLPQGILCQTESVTLRHENGIEASMHFREEHDVVLVNIYVDKDENPHPMMMRALAIARIDIVNPLDPLGSDAKEALLRLIDAWESNSRVRFTTRGGGKEKVGRFEVEKGNFSILPEGDNIRCSIDPRRIIEIEIL